MAVALFSNGVGLDPNTCWQDLVTDGTLDGTGFTSSIKYICSGNGVATALGVSTTTVQCASITFNGHTISSTDVAAITVTPNTTFSGNVTVTGTLTAAGFLSSTLTSGRIFVGNSSNVATGVAMSGDGAMANTGALTIASIGGKAVSLANSFTMSGNFGFTGTLTGTTTVTYPTSGTLATLTGTELLTNKTINSAQGADIVSASTTDIGAATGNYVKVTGTTTITALGTVQAGTIRFVTFTGALILTHNATSLILPSGANITTVAGDNAMFVSEGSGNWRCVRYNRADGKPLIPTYAIASQSDQETGSSAVTIVTPSAQQFHQSAAKCWLKANGAGTTINASYNITSLTDTGTGVLDVVIGTDFSGADWGFSYTIINAGLMLWTCTAQAAGAITLKAFNSGTGAAQDPTSYSFTGFGDQ